MLFYKRYLMISVCLLTAFHGSGQDLSDYEVDELYDISETFTVSAATVEVIVTRKKGERVTGLTRSDFVLTVDGSPVPTHYFAEVGGAIEADTTGEVPAQEEGDHVIPAVSAPRNYLIFIDDYFSHPAYRRMLFDRMLANVDAMRDGDQMAVVHYRGRKPNQSLPWTGNRDLLRQVLSDIADNKPTDMRRRALLQAGDLEEGSRLRPTPENVDTDSAYFSAGGQREPENFGLSETNFDEEDDWKNGVSLSGMSAFRRVAHLERMVTTTTRSVELAMRGLPKQEGRNILVLMSSGWPYQFRKFLDMKFANLPGQKDGGEWLLRPITDTANLLGYTIYPMLIGQTNAGNFTGAESPSFADFSSNSGFEVKHDSLAFLADQTGGRLLSKAQFLKLPLSEVAGDNRHYYVLGFSTNGLIEGERHRIEVTTRDRSLRVRHRKEFRARTAEEQGDMEMENILLTGKKLDQLGVTLGASIPQNRRHVMVPLTVAIPLNWATLEQEGDQYLGRFTLRVTAEDLRGNRAELVREPIELTVGQAQTGAMSSYDASLLLRKKKQRLVFSLHDEMGGNTLSSTVDFLPTKKP